MLKQVIHENQVETIDLSVPAGELFSCEVVATFDEKINDGLAYYDAGDYFFVYNITVDK